MKSIATFASMGIAIFGGLLVLGILPYILAFFVAVLMFATPIGIDILIPVSLEYLPSHVSPIIPIKIPCIGLLVSIVLKNLKKQKLRYSGVFYLHLLVCPFDVFSGVSIDANLFTDLDKERDLHGSTTFDGRNFVAASYC